MGASDAAAKGKKAAGSTEKKKGPREAYTSFGEPVKVSYGPKDLPGFDYEQDLGDPEGYLATLVDRRLRTGIVELLDDAERRALFDRWVRTTAEDLLRRHHHQIGLTVRENLDALETDALVAQIEARVGADLQFIRLNGALVGGLIGVALALLHRLTP